MQAILPAGHQMAELTPGGARRHQHVGIDDKQPAREATVVSSPCRSGAEAGVMVHCGLQAVLRGDSPARWLLWRSPWLDGSRKSASKWNNRPRKKEPCL